MMPKNSVQVGITFDFIAAIQNPLSLDHLQLILATSESCVESFTVIKPFVTSQMWELNNLAVLEL